MNTSFTLLALLAAAPTLGGHVALSPDRAAPRIIMFHGGSLEGRRYLTDYWENQQFMGAIAQPSRLSRDALTRVRFIEVTLYWHGPTWERHATDTALLRRLRPDAGQPARLYLGEDEVPPLFDYSSAPYTPGLRTIDPTGLAILKRNNVPVSLATLPGR
jgi:hypothetical protein